MKFNNFNMTNKRSRQIFLIAEAIIKTSNGSFKTPTDYTEAFNSANSTLKMKESGMRWLLGVIHKNVPTLQKGRHGKYGIVNSEEATNSFMGAIKSIEECNTCTGEKAVRVAKPKEKEGLVLVNHFSIDGKFVLQENIKTGKWGVVNPDGSEFIKAESDLSTLLKNYGNLKKVTMFKNLGK